MSQQAHGDNPVDPGLRPVLVNTAGKGKKKKKKKNCPLFTPTVKKGKEKREGKEGAASA